MGHTTRAAGGIFANANHNKHHSYLPRPPAPFFHPWRGMTKFGKSAVVRQGEATIVVLVLQIIAREHGTNHKCCRWLVPMPVTIHSTHIYQGRLPPFFIPGEV